jgi:hypothetical protein
MLCMLCMVEIRESSTSESNLWPQLDDFMSWIGTRIDELAEHDDSIGAAARRGKSMNSAQHLGRIEELGQSTSVSQAAPVSDLVKRVFDNRTLLLQGHMEPVDVLILDDGLTKFYNLIDGLSDYHDLCATPGHNDPGLRVLEIGAGTG